VFAATTTPTYVPSRHLNAVLFELFCNMSEFPPLI